MKKCLAWVFSSLFALRSYLGTRMSMYASSSARMYAAAARGVRRPAISATDAGDAGAPASSASAANVRLNPPASLTSDQGARPLRTASDMVASARALAASGSPPARRQGSAPSAA